LGRYKTHRLTNFYKGELQPSTLPIRVPFAKVPGPVRSLLLGGALGGKGVVVGGGEVGTSHIVATVGGDAVRHDLSVLEAWHGCLVVGWHRTWRLIKARDEKKKIDYGPIDHSMLFFWRCSPATNYAEN